MARKIPNTDKEYSIFPLSEGARPECDFCHAEYAETLVVVYAKHIDTHTLCVDCQEIYYPAENARTSMI